MSWFALTDPDLNPPLGLAGDRWRPEPPQPFGVAHELQPAPEHGIVRRLACMESDGTMLNRAVDTKHDVDLTLATAGEAGAEGGIEGIGTEAGIDHAITGRSSDSPARNAASVAR